MILVDANVLMYAAGAEHRNKNPSIVFLGQVARNEVEATLDAEVLQEVLHRYRAINRWEAGRQVYDRARRLFHSVLPINVECLDDARILLDRNAALGARDALHAAVVRIYGLEAICSYDGGFEGIEGVRRVEPTA